MSKILAGKEDVQKRNASCIDQIQARKRELTNKLNIIFDEMIQEVAKQTTELDGNIDEEIATIEEHLVLVDSIKANTDGKCARVNDVKKRLETLKAIRHNIDEKIASPKLYKYLKYIESRQSVDEVEKLTGSVTQKHIKVNMPPAKVSECITEKETASMFTCKGKT